MEDTVNRYHLCVWNPREERENGVEPVFEEIMD